MSEAPENSTMLPPVAGQPRVAIAGQASPLRRLVSQPTHNIGNSALRRSVMTSAVYHSGCLTLFTTSRCLQICIPLTTKMSIIYRHIDVCLDNRKGRKFIKTLSENEKKLKLTRVRHQRP